MNETNDNFTSIKLRIEALGYRVAYTPQGNLMARNDAGRIFMCCGSIKKLYKMILSS